MNALLGTVALTVLSATAAQAASAGYTLVTIAESGGALTGARFQPGNVNDRGELVFADFRSVFRPGFGANAQGFARADNLVVVRPTGSEIVLEGDSRTDTQAFAPKINIGGDVAYAFADGTATTQIRVLEAGGTNRFVAADVFSTVVPDPAQNQFQSIQTAFAFNDAGQIAALVDSGILRFENDAAPGDLPTVTTIDTPVTGGAAGTNRFSFTGPSIAPDGTVAWRANTDRTVTNNGTKEVIFVGDGTTVEEALVLGDVGGLGGSGARPGINASNTVIASSPDSIDGGAITATGRVGEAPTVVGPDFGGIAEINDFGSTLVSGSSTFAGSILVDGQTVISQGDSFDGGTITRIDIDQIGNFNNSGQFAFLIEVDNNRHVLVRADPPGASPETALVPTSNPAPGVSEIEVAISNGLGVLAPIFLDPVVATGFTYEVGPGAETFASVLIPTALPGGDADFFVEFDAGGALQSFSLAAGETFDFLSVVPAGVSSFFIGGIDPGEGVDPDDPFIAGVTFVAGDFTSTVTITAQTAVVGEVPLPASAWLMVAGLGLCGLAARRRTA